VLLDSLGLPSLVADMSTSMIDPSFENGLDQSAVLRASLNMMLFLRPVPGGNSQEWQSCPRRKARRSSSVHPERFVWGDIRRRTCADRFLLPVESAKGSFQKTGWVGHARVHRRRWFGSTGERFYWLYYSVRRRLQTPTSYGDWSTEEPPETA